MGDVDDGCVLMGVIVMINWGGGEREWVGRVACVDNGCWRWVLAMGVGDG